jgi:hypothetical protein
VTAVQVSIADQLREAAERALSGRAAGRNRLRVGRPFGTYWPQKFVRLLFAPRSTQSTAVSGAGRALGAA